MCARQSGVFLVTQLPEVGFGRELVRYDARGVLHPILEVCVLSFLLLSSSPSPSSSLFALRKGLRGLRKDFDNPLGILTQLLGIWDFCIFCFLILGWCLSLWGSLFIMFGGCLSLWGSLFIIKKKEEEGRRRKKKEEEGGRRRSKWRPTKIQCRFQAKIVFRIVYN